MFIGYFIFGIVALVSWLISQRLQSKFEKYSRIPVPRGMTGKDVAQKMLRDNGIYDVQVISTNGHLTDHIEEEDKKEMRQKEEEILTAFGYKREL
jgi:Zn-dependent membrane protease YugP